MKPTKDQSAAAVARETAVPMPANSIASEMFLDDAFSAIRARLAMLAACDPSRIDPSIFSDALVAFVDEISDALSYHEANRTPWPRKKAPAGANGADDE
ncbi:hypothetical protein [uncultured Thiodictyon sp.]|jgi:hypothetical protein|uniref:hypothetical protein n=1 Tax=uncultured Thiodictyon sp. TaxID=1846217 RepID=UPI0025FEA10F|nr:hypothetical protein [uncultured Thiodictyon sp.]